MSQGISNINLVQTIAKFLNIQNNETLLKFIITIFVTILFYLIYQPAKMYYSQEAEIQSYKEKWGMNKVKTNKIYLHANEEMIDHRAILRIENKESVDLNRCRGQAIKVMVGDGKNWEDRTHMANGGGAFLTWFYHGDVEEWTVQRDTSNELLCVAIRYDSGNIGFTHHARVKTVNKDKLSAMIYVEIQIDGYMNEKPIEPIYFKGFIRQNGNDIYLEKGELQ